MERVPFTGFDGFLLTLEKHYSQLGLEGNICRYVIDLDGLLNKDDFQRFLESHETVVVLDSLIAEKTNPIFTPYWRSVENKEGLLVCECESDELIPEIISSNKLTPSTQLMSFDLVKRSTGYTTLIFSWHHLLMDGFGAALLLKQIFGNEGAHINLFGEENPKFTFKTFLQAAKAKFFIDKSSRSPVSTLISKKILLSGNGSVRVINFNQEEVNQIDERALGSGAKFGRSAYYLACCSRAVKSVLEKRGVAVRNFWIPVPIDDRRKGATGPIVGNRLSFLFYRIKNDSMHSIQACVNSINAQMINQISSRMPAAYNHLMNFMKWLPLRIYLYLVKRRSGNAIASFLFTVAATHPEDFNKVEGRNVMNALSLPANPCPPGLTFAFMKFKDTLQLMMLYQPEAVSNDEIQYLEEHIKHDLMEGENQVDEKA